MATPRTKANARRALRALFWPLAIAAVFVFVQTTDSEAGRVWRKFAMVVIVVAMIVLPTASRHIAPWIARHDVTWRLASLVLYATMPFRWLVAAIWKTVRGFCAALAATRAFGFLDRHRRTVGIVLVAAISLRSLAALSLLQQGAEITLWHLAALGPTYLAFGVTAPFVALLLLSRRSEWALVTAIIWLLFGCIGVALALMFSALMSSAHLPLLAYPLFPEPVHISLFLSLGFAELLVQMVALHYLSGRTVDYYHGVSSKAG